THRVGERYEGADGYDLSGGEPARTTLRRAGDPRRDHRPGTASPLALRGVRAAVRRGGRGVTDGPYTRAHQRPAGRHLETAGMADIAEEVRGWSVSRSGQPPSSDRPRS